MAAVFARLDFEPRGQHSSPSGGASDALSGGMTLETSFVAVRHLDVDGRRIPVLLSRNSGGSIAARCMLSEVDTPILDAPSVEEALAALEDLIESLLFARRAATP